MAPQTLTDYERRRLDNIRSNAEMISSLMLQCKASDLSSSLKRQPAPKPDPYPKKLKTQTQTQTQTPIVLRRSLRTRGITYNSSDSTAAAETPTPKTLPTDSQPGKQGPLLIRDAFVKGPTNSDSPLMGAILNALREPRGDGVKDKDGFDPRSGLVLRPENVTKVVSERILSVRFLPFGDWTVVVVGNRIGNIGFWDVDSSDGDGVYVYQPHSDQVSGISVHPFSPTKIFSSSYDGFIRLMDIEKETFNVVHSSDYLFYSICQWPHDSNSLSIGEGGGMLTVWDERVGKASSLGVFHESRINTIDFNPENVHLMATGSSDKLSCIWDLRSLKKYKPESIQLVCHEKSVHSAYFSPSGNYLATTSFNKLELQPVLILMMYI